MLMRASNINNNLILRTFVNSSLKWTIGNQYELEFCTSKMMRVMNSKNVILVCFSKVWV